MAPDQNDTEKEFERYLAESKKAKELARNKEYPFLAKFSLIGFLSDTDEIILDSDHIIKRIPVEERDAFYERSKLGNYENLYMQYEHLLYCYYTDKGGIGYSKELDEKQKLTKVFFNLIKNKSVNVTYCHRFTKYQQENDFRSAGFFSFKEDAFQRDNALEIPKSKSSWLKNIWKNYTSVEIQKNKAFRVATNRLYYSFNRYHPEDQVVDLMIAFEAIFVRRGERISLKLPQRCSSFLQSYFQKQQLFQFMKDAYNVRSRLVHGDNLETGDLKYLGKNLTLQEWANQLSKILSLSLLEYIENFHTLNTVNLVKQIDRSIVVKK